MDRFFQKTAFVTGGAKGIGFAIASRMAREGAKVWLADRDQEALNEAVENLRNEGANADAVLLDITTEQSLIKGLRHIIDIDKSLDIVINSAGIVGPTGIKTDEIHYDQFRQTLLVNVEGAFLVTKLALQLMLPHNSGRILHIASIAGKEGNAGMCAYSASKAAVIGMVKAAGKEYADSGITINAIAPATVMTEMVKAMPAQQVRYMTDKIPMKRCCELDEIASLASWIVSGEASFNTGCVFDLSGGRAVY